MANGTVDGTLVGLTIEDDADYRYRGLMIDTGRRFVPKADILNSLDAMSASMLCINMANLLGTNFFVAV